MAVSLDIKLKRADKIYKETESIAGVVSISTNSDLKHDGITLFVEGSVNLQLSSKNVGIIEAFYNSVKPIQLVGISCEVSGPSKIPSGLTEIPFEIPLKPKPNRALYETYHGVYVNISYSIRCEIKRSFLSKDLQKTQQFLVQYWPGRMPSPAGGLASGGVAPPKTKENHRHPVQFNLSPASLAAGSKGAPDFLLRGHLTSTHCNITKPFTGHIVLERCAAPVRSVELQLVRVETCGCAEGYAREEFEVNLVVIFQDDHLVTNNFPIVLVRE